MKGLALIFGITTAIALASSASGTPDQLDDQLRQLRAENARLQQIVDNNDDLIADLNDQIANTGAQQLRDEIDSLVNEIGALQRSDSQHWGMSGARDSLNSATKALGRTQVRLDRTLADIKQTRQQIDQTQRQIDMCREMLASMRNDSTPAIPADVKPDSTAIEE